MKEIKLIKIDKVDEELPQEIVKRIVNVVNPFKDSSFWLLGLW